MGLIWETSFVSFFIITVVLGGTAAWLSGSGLAQGWRPVWVVCFFMALLAMATRFFSWALADGTLLSLHYYIVEFAVLAGLALLSYRLTRTRQMVRQYPWLYRRTSPLSWTTR